jgi:IS30 family transposase
MARRQRDAVLERDERLARFVRDRLTEGRSPQQISGWLHSGAEPGLRTLVMEPVYAFIYRACQKAEELWRYLVRRRVKRRKFSAKCHSSRPAAQNVSRN